LAELENRLQFLKRKVNILRQGIAEGGRDMQVPFRDFVTKTYGSKYPIILQDMNAFDRCISKRVEIVDLSDEAAEKFRAYVDELVGDEPIQPACLDHRSFCPATIGPATVEKASTETAALKKALADKAAAEKAAAEEKAAIDKAMAEKATAEMEAAKKAAAEKAEAEKKAAQEAAPKAAENAPK
jgi:flagellar biosynthesis GTPase FlhF